MTDHAWVLIENPGRDEDLGIYTSDDVAVVHIDLQDLGDDEDYARETHKEVTASMLPDVVKRRVLDYIETIWPMLAPFYCSECHEYHVRDLHESEDA